MLTRLIALAILVSASTKGEADIIEISGSVDPNNEGYWNVTTIFGAYSDVASTLQSQVWWEEDNLASLFALTLAGSLGFPNANGIRGPAFNVTEVGSLFGGSPPVQGWWWREAGALRGYRASTSAELTWAVATRVAVPEPGTLALLALGLLGIAARRRMLSACFMPSSF